MKGGKKKKGGRGGELRRSRPFKEKVKLIIKGLAALPACHFGHTSNFPIRTFEQFCRGFADPTNNQTTDKMEQVGGKSFQISPGRTDLVENGQGAAQVFSKKGRPKLLEHLAANKSHNLTYLLTGHLRTAARAHLIHET